MKLMPVLPESIFDILYLIFAIAGGIILLYRAKGRRLIRVFGMMTLLPELGDSFHLVPRAELLDRGDHTAALGIGIPVTSVAMTVFCLPVVVWAQEISLIGMLMLPKICMYIWMILMFRKTEKE